MENVLPAQEVQEMIDVEDFEIVAHGYTFDRNTVDIWFENGLIFRHEYKYDPRQEIKSVSRISETFFNASFFFADIKRWYESKFNTKLRTLMRTFSEHEPPMVRG